MISSPTRRILLIGFMGAGKSSVGRVLAHALGWGFLDADDAIEARLGASIAEVFETRGEGFFRGQEREAMKDLLHRDAVVIAAGGGWAARPEWTEDVPRGSATVWLQVSPAEVSKRLRAEPGKRPLMPSEPSASVVRELVEARTPSYALADRKVDTEGCSVEDVSARILEMFSGNDLIMDAE